jgi:hypothetical protein
VASAHVSGATAHILDGHGHISLALEHFGAILDDLVATAPPARQSNT